MNDRIKRLLKFCLSSLIIYFVVKAPIMWLLTEFGDVHYLVSGFIAGTVPTLANFVPSEYWVWKKK